MGNFSLPGIHTGTITIFVKLTINIASLGVGYVGDGWGVVGACDDPPTKIRKNIFFWQLGL